MIKLYTTMALSSISRSRWRSFLTMLGVIIGVMSVVMIFALGEGLKRQVAGELKEVGTDSVVVRSGKIVERDTDGNVSKVNLNDVFSQSSLTENDVETLRAAPQVSMLAPLAFLSAPVTTAEDAPITGEVPIIATTPQIRDVLGRDVENGEFFTTPELDKNLVVLGPQIAKRIFGDDSPVGRIIKIKNTDFIIRGVMEETKPSPLDLVNADYNNALYIPFNTAKRLNGNVLGIREIHLKLAETEDADKAVKSIDDLLATARLGVKDYSILQGKDYISILDNVFGVVTTFIGAVAGISLLVGGIGIMNIMLVSVTERTREIGIRKAIGATNQQILGQFLVEAIILTLIGGLIAVGLSGGLTVILRVYTDLQPFMQYKIVLIAMAVTLAVGIIFGLVPAAKAARKDPIESLR